VVHEALLGRVGEAFRMQLETGKIREFARATKSAHLAFDEDSPVIPATFLQTAVFWQDERSSPWGGAERNLSRILHGEQEFVFPDGPPRAGTALTGRVRVDKVYEKRGKRGGTMTFVEVVTEYRDDAGTLVAEARNVTIETSVPAGSGRP
jgi:N-terminal half of MaoC dehydratase